MEPDRPPVMIDRNFKLLTIVTEAALENELRQDLENLGASGYTIVNARGKGSRGIRDAGWTTDRNIRVEIICDAVLAEKIAEHMQEHYYRDFAMVMYISDVGIMRPEKF